MSSKALARVSVQSGAKELNAALKRLQKTQIFVGIAKGEGNDKRRDGGPDNHLLGYIHEKGSPAANIPARPFLVPGIESAKKDIQRGLRAVMKAALADDENAVDKLLERTGLQAVSAVKKYITSADFEPLSPKYLKYGRHKARLTKGKRDNEVAGEDVRPLINTGALRDSLDFYLEGH